VKEKSWHMKQIKFKDIALSPLGMGGCDLTFRKAESIKAIRYGLEHGINIIDTAESYYGSEELMGQAIQPFDRGKIFLISKISPSHANREQFAQHLKASLTKLGTDYLDLYLLHWRADTNLAEVVDLFEQARQAGLIRHWGVSNFDQSDLEDLLQVQSGKNVFANEDLYNLASRGVEYDLLPFQKQQQILFLSYSPFHAVGWRQIRPNQVLTEIAHNHHASAYQIMLAWIMRTGQVIPLPKAGTWQHVKANIAAAELHLTPDELAAIDQLYPALTHKIPLQKI
jgi:diketogulonate reductase-like aldo/keto reductase